MKGKNKVIIYQSKTGKIEFRGDFQKDTIWGSLSQIADLFGRDKSVVSRHIKNIFNSGELSKSSVVVKIATTAHDGKTYQVDYYNLDAIMSIGYRLGSNQATKFRVWAIKTLKQHLIKGYTINENQINRNYQSFMESVSGVKAVLPKEQEIKGEEVMDLISAFAGTWFSLDAYDRDKSPKGEQSKKKISIVVEELGNALWSFKEELKGKGQASDLFGQERNTEVIKGVMGSIFQSFGGKEIYPSIEEKSANFLYLMIKNHLFVNGNKRSAVFSFV